MGLLHRLLSAAFFCEQCQKETRFLPLPSARALTGVSRSTIYSWMERDQVHWFVLYLMAAGLSARYYFRIDLTD